MHGTEQARRAADCQSYPQLGFLPKLHRYKFLPIITLLPDGAVWRSAAVRLARGHTNLEHSAPGLAESG